jgi:hypothetical protein
MPERQVTSHACGHILTNIAAWSADSQWLVYDVRSDVAGAVFDGVQIERVSIQGGAVEVLYRSSHGACCGVATCSPVGDDVVFILGPENPTADWQYGPDHRQGVVVKASQPGIARNLDARDLTPPFTAGALRGGSHVHVFSGDGQCVSFTYEDHVLARRDQQLGGARSAASGDLNQRNVGVASRGTAVQPGADHPRNCDGDFFSVLVTKTLNEPQPGSDEISEAYDDAWVGENGYLRSDGTRQPRAIAFLGDVVATDGQRFPELFLVDLPDDLTVAGESPLEGTQTTRPAPPRGTRQRRLTRTADRRFPGLSGPRQWPRSSSDGSQIAFCMRDDLGVVQLWTISPNGGKERQVTHLPFGVASAFSWHPDGKHIAFIADNSVYVTNVDSGESVRSTPRAPNGSAPRPEACVFSPDGKAIAFVRPIDQGGAVHNQIFVVGYGVGAPQTKLK